MRPARRRPYLPQPSVEALRARVDGEPDDPGRPPPVTRAELVALLDEVEDGRRSAREDERTPADSVAASRRRLCAALRDWFATAGRRDDLARLCAAAAAGDAPALAGILAALEALGRPASADAGPPGNRASSEI